MKTIALIFACVLLFVGIVSAQAPYYMYHNNRVESDSITYLVGQTADTSESYDIRRYERIRLTTFCDENSSQDSSSISVFVDVSPTGSGLWAVKDTLVCDSTVASLPTTNEVDLSATCAGAQYLRLRTSCKNGTNDSSVVANRLTLQQ